MATTLTQAQGYVREYLNEPNPVFWSNQQLTDYINQGCADIARRCETKQTTTTIAAVANQQSYTGPADMLRVHRIEFVQTGSTNTYTLEFRGYMEMDQLWGINQNWPANYPLYYTIWFAPPAIKIVVYPVPSSTGTFTVYYYQQITPAVAGSDNIDIIPGWEDLVYDYATYRALRQDADPRWKEFKDVYEANLNNLYDISRDWQDQGNFVSTGQVALPAWLINDDMGW
jgi:hypothetical protein